MKLRNYKFSFVFGIILIVFHFFHDSILSKIPKIYSTMELVFLIILSVFFLSIILKIINKKNDEQIALILLLAGIIFYFFLIKSNAFPNSKISLFEFFVLGLIFAIEKGKKKSLLPILFIFIFAVLSEFSTHKSFSISFYHYDIFIKSIIALTGYLSIRSGLG